jgi:hypothetical protein
MAVYRAPRWVRQEGMAFHRSHEPTDGPAVSTF